MAIFRRYVAPRRDLFLVFAACAFPIFAWSIVIMLEHVPAWVLRSTAWDLIGAIAYVQVYALLETTLVFLALVLLGAILPARFLRDHFVTQAGTLGLGVSAGAVLIRVLWLTEISRHPVWWLAAFLISVCVLSGLTLRYEKLEAVVRSLIERLAVVSTVYVSVGILSLVVVIVRNI